MSVGLKHLYSGKEDKRGRFQWQTEMPEDLGKPAEDAESEKWAIIVRNVKVYNDPKKVLSLHSILIQSPLLKDLLKEVLAGYPGVTVGLKRLEFSGRFEPLIHRWAELKEAIVKLSVDKDEASAAKQRHAELLQDLLSKEFKETIDAAGDLRNQGVMTYEHLWTLFQPGSFVYSRQQGQDRVFRLHSSKYGQDRNGHPVFWLTCQYIDYVSLLPDFPAVFTLGISNVGIAVCKSCTNSDLGWHSFRHTEIECEHTHLRRHTANHKSSNTSNRIPCQQRRTQEEAHRARRQGRRLRWISLPHVPWRWLASRKHGSQGEVQHQGPRGARYSRLEQIQS